MALPTCLRLWSPTILGRWRQNGSLSILRHESQNFAILIWMFLKENWLESSLNVAVNGYELELSVSSTGTAQPCLLQPSEALFRTLPRHFHRVAAWPWSNCFGIFVVCHFPFIIHLKAFWNTVFFFPFFLKTAYKAKLNSVLETRMCSFNSKQTGKTLHARCYFLWGW